MSGASKEKGWMREAGEQSEPQLESFRLVNCIEFNAEVLQKASALSRSECRIASVKGPFLSNRSVDSLVNSHLLEELVEDDHDETGEDKLENDEEGVTGTEGSEVLCVGKGRAVSEIKASGRVY